MGRAQELRRTAGDNAKESLGAGRLKIAGGPAPPASEVPPVEERYRDVARAKGVLEIPTDKIAPDPEQPRKHFDDEALDRLAENLKSRGQLQPIRVRWAEAAGSYRIVAGQRRWEAARRAGLATLVAKVVA